MLRLIIVQNKMFTLQIRFLHQIRNITMMKVSLIVLVLTLTMTRKLIFVQQVFRHGARYPVKAMQNDNTSFVNDLKLNGQLTSQGKHMQYLLGKIMYQQYWNLLFGDTPYNQSYHPSQFYVKSTNVNRTIQSAQSQLVGLLQSLKQYKLPVDQLQYSLPAFKGADKYQPQIGTNSTQFTVFGLNNGNYQTIPIHMERQIFIPDSATYKYRSNPFDQGDFLSKYEPQNCPNQVLWGKQSMASEDALSIKNSKEVQQFLANLSQTVGKKVSYQEVFHYIDNYYCLKYLGKSYLSLFNQPKYLKTADFIFLSSTLFMFFYTKNQVRTSNTMLLQKTVYNVKQALANKGPKLVLYSCHDTNLLSLASAFQMTSISCLKDYFYKGIDNSDTCINYYPPFASNFILEVWQEDNLSHTIKIKYNGQYRKIPVCGMSQNCPFASFQKWVDGFSLQSPNEVCGIHLQYWKLYIVIGILGLLIAIFVIIQMKARFNKKMAEKMKNFQEMNQLVGSRKQGYAIHVDQKGQFDDHPELE